MQILSLLGMYFDAAVVFVTNSSLFSDWLWPYCVEQCFFTVGQNNFRNKIPILDRIQRQQQASKKDPKNSEYFDAVSIMSTRLSISSTKKTQLNFVLLPLSGQYCNMNFSYYHGKNECKIRVSLHFNVCTKD